MSSRPVYQMCAQVAPSGECLRGEGPPDRMLANLGAVSFWQPIPSGLNLVVAAVLRDSLCVVSLLPCVTVCMLYTVCKVKRFVLTIIKRKIIIINNVYSAIIIVRVHPVHLMNVKQQQVSADPQTNTSAASLLLSSTPTIAIKYYSAQR